MLFQFIFYLSNSNLEKLTCNSTHGNESIASNDALFKCSSRPTLKHQREPEKNAPKPVKLDTYYERGNTVRFVQFSVSFSHCSQGQRATHYRKGACANCGAMTHKERDCLEVLRLRIVIYLRLTSFAAPAQGGSQVYQ